jgi:hypothetical protein
MTNTRNLLEIENAQILFKNFSGREKTAMVRGSQRVVNEEGKKNFNVVLDPEKSDIYWNGEKVTNPDFGQELANLGFNVSVKPGKEEGEAPQYRLPVHVAFDNITPEIYLVTGNHKVKLDYQTISCLDTADIVSADISINNGRPYIGNDGTEKVKAWCNKGFFVIAQSRFDSKYDFE